MIDRVRDIVRDGEQLHPGGSVSIVHDGLYIVSREQPCGAAHDALKPAIVVLLNDVDDRSFLEG